MNDLGISQDALLLATTSLGVLAGWLVARRRPVEAGQLFSGEEGPLFNCPFFIVDVDTKEKISCHVIEPLLGAKAPILSLADIKKTLSPESIDLLDARIEKNAQAGALEPFVLKTLHHSFIECVPASQPVQKGDRRLLLLLLQDVTPRHRQQLMLHSENEVMKEEMRRYGAIMNSLRSLVWVRDRDYKIQYCNLSYARAVEELSASATDIGVPELHRGMMKLAQTVRESGKEQSERHHIVVEGKRRLFLVREMYLPEMEVSIGFADDITELEEAEEEIRNYLSAQEDLLESSTSAVAIFGADMRLKFYNQAYVRMWSYDEAWLDNAPSFPEILEYLREKRRLPEQANFQAYKKQHLKLFTELEPREELHFLPDGRTLRSVSIPHAQGGIILSYEDVTDRLALERSYNTLIAVQRETLDNLHEGIIVFGEDGRVRLSNPGFRKIWSLAEDDVVERTHLHEILEKVRPQLGKEDWEEYSQAFMHRIQSREIYASRMERRDGTVLDCTIVPLPDGGTLLSSTDVTDSTLVERSLREKNEALEAADSLKTEFLANVSYELRSPLTSISGFSEMLRQNYFGELNERQKEYVENIHDSAQHLSGLINDILDLAGIEAGYLTLDISTVDIHAMLDAMLPLLNERLRHHHLQVKIDCPADIGTMRGDGTRLKQVLFHLLSNAIKYSNEDGNITLGARREKDYLRLWVSDEGVGIAAHEQKAIFEKFYRGAAGSSKSGTGLGLSMVKNFIELHGGKVALDSVFGKGTTVTCFVPYNPPSAVIEE